MTRRKKSDKKKEELKVNPELEGLKININSLGEINSNYDIDKINKFLDKEIDDKKLKGNNKRKK